MWLVLPRASKTMSHILLVISMHDHGREIDVFEIKIGLIHSQIGLKMRFNCTFDVLDSPPGPDLLKFISFCIRHGYGRVT